MKDIEKKHKISRENFLNQLAIELEHQNWNKELLEIVEKKCNFIHNYHMVLFANGIDQIIEEFEKWQDEQMLDTLKTQKEPLKIREKIAIALETRLMRVVSKEVILKQNALFLEPCNLFLGAQCFAKTCDVIWNYAGDKSDDFNYYTKRGLLLGVYASTRLLYLSDESKDFINTKEFIKSSLDNIVKIATSFSRAMP